MWKIRITRALGLVYSAPISTKGFQIDFGELFLLISLGMRWYDRILFLLIFLFLGEAVVFAQKRDSLASILAKGTLSPEEELQTLEALFKETDGSDSSSGIYIRRILEIALAQKDYSTYAKWSVAFFHSEAPGMLSVREKISQLKKAAAYEQYITESQVKGNVFLKLGGAYFSLLEYDSAISYYDKSIQRFGLQDSIYVADAKFFTGQAYDYQGDLIKAMKSYQEARDLYEALDDQEYVHFVIGGMAILFSRFGIYDEADQLRQSVIQFSTKNGQSGETAIQLYNRAEDLRKQNRYQEQLETLLQIEKMMPLQPENLYFEGVYYLSLANYYGKKGSLPQQLFYYQKAQEIINRVPALQGEHLTVLYSQALIKKNQNDPSGANLLAKRYFELAKSSDDMDHLIRSREILAETFSAIGDEKAAASTWKDLNDFKDSLNSVNQSTSFAYYQTLYETEKKERQLLNKTQELEVANQKSAARTRIFLIFIATILVAAVGTFLAKSLKQAKKEKTLQEKFSRELLKSQEEERKRISKDLHDGLGQSLLLIKNRVALSRDDNTGQMLDTAISELRAIARSLHPMQLEKLGLSRAIEQLCDQIDRETTLFVSQEIEDIKGKLSKEQELHLYRILQECLNNILKHAEASAIRVSLVQQESKINLTIEDNGKGFDFSDRFQDFQSLGLKTLKERTAAIQGVMKVTSEKGKGSQFTFTLYV